MSHRVPAHTHTVIVGRQFTEATQYTADSDGSSHVHRLTDGRLEPVKLWGIWHTHRLERISSAGTFTVGALA